VRTPQIVRDLAALPGPVWVLCAGMFVNRFGSFVLPWLVLWMTRRGYDPLQAGFAGSAYGVGSLAAALLGGALADRLGRRQTIVVSMFGSGVAMLLLSRAATMPAIVAMAAVAGVFAELYRPAIGALVTDLTPPSQRVTAFAAVRLAINLGITVGPLVAAFLAERAFTLLFVGDAITSIAFGLVALVALPNVTTPVHAAADTSREGWWASLRRDRPMQLTWIASLFGALVYMQHLSGLPLQVNAAGLGNPVYGMLLSLNAVLVVALELPLTRWTSRMPRHVAMALGNALVGVGFAITGLPGGVPLLIASVAIWTLGEIAGAPVMSAFVSVMAPDHLRGRYMATFGMSWAFALALAPLLGGALFARDPQLLWGGCLVLGLAAAWLVWLASRLHDARAVIAEREVASPVA
jgi:MFS family permease